MIQFGGVHLVATVFSFAIFYGLWNMFGLVLYQYLKARIKLGANQVKIIYRPFTNYLELISESERIFKHSHGYYHDVVRRYPETKLIFIKLFGTTWLYVIGSDMVRTTSLNIVTHFDRLFDMPFMSELQNGIIFSRGQRWKQSRKLISDIFNFENLQKDQETILKIIDSKIGNLDGTIPDLLKFGKSISSEVIMNTFLGKDFSTVKFEQGETAFFTLQKYICMALDENLKLLYKIRVLLFGQARGDSYFLTPHQKFIVGKIHYMKQTVKQYVRKQKQKAKTSDDISPFIRKYLNLNTPQHEEEMVEQILSFMIAGTDTTGGLIQSCISYLATYPQYQDIILKDTEQYTQNIHDSPQLNNFVNQVLRLRGTVQMGAPIKVLKPLKVENYDLPVNIFLINCYAGIGKNPLFWDNAEEFNPERYKEKNATMGIWMPFGTGPRACIGKHMALLDCRQTIVRLLQKYRIQKVGTSLDMGSDFIVNVIKDKKYVKFVAK